MNQDRFVMPNRDELNALLQHANQMRAEALGKIAGKVWHASTAAGRALFTGLAAFASTFAAALRAQTRYAELSRMSDRQLADLGLTRSDIAAAVVGVFQGQRRVAASAEVTQIKTPAETPAVPPLREAA